MTQTANSFAILQEFGTKFDSQLFKTKIDWSSLSQTVLQRPIKNRFEKIHLSKQIKIKKKSKKSNSVPPQFHFFVNQKYRKTITISENQQAGLTPVSLKSQKQKSWIAFKTVSRTIMSLSSLKNVTRRGGVKQVHESPDYQLSLSCQCSGCHTNMKLKKIGNIKIKKAIKSLDDKFVIAQEAENLEVSLTESRSNGEAFDVAQKSPQVWYQVQEQVKSKTEIQVKKSQRQTTINSLNSSKSNVYLQQKKKEHVKFSNFVLKIKKQKSVSSFDYLNTKTARVETQKDNMTETRLKTEPARKSFKMYYSGQKGLLPYIK